MLEQALAFPVSPLTANTLPPLIREYRATLAEIEAIERAAPKQEGTGLDEFTRKLAERSSAAGGARAAGGRQRR